MDKHKAPPLFCADMVDAWRLFTWLKPDVRPCFIHVATMRTVAPPKWENPASWFRGGVRHVQIIFTGVIMQPSAN